MLIPEELYGRLSAPVAAMLRMLSGDEEKALEEIRLRTGRPLELVIAGRTRTLDFAPDSKAMDELLAALSGYALYSCERQMAQGYMPLAGGHRAGVCGRMVAGEDGALRMAEVTSVCIRIARMIPGAGKGIYRRLLAPDGRARRVLLLGTPGCGKTTMLRDCALYLSNHAGLHVAVADEREELSGLGEAGERIDVISGADKARAFAMLIRTMAPQVLVCDEIGKTEDADALLDAARCGVGVLATAHAGGMGDVLLRPALRKLFEAGAFERYVLLGRHACVCGVWNERGEALTSKEETEHDDEGYSGDGDDSDQCRRLFAL